MINKKEKLKVMSIINICNTIKSNSNNKDDVEFWILKIKEICEIFLID